MNNRLYELLSRNYMTKTSFPAYVGKKVINIEGYGDMTVNKGIKLLHKLIQKSDDPKLSYEQATALKRQAGEINTQIHNTTKSIMEAVNDKSRIFLKHRPIEDNKALSAAKFKSELDASDRYIREQERIKTKAILDKPHTAIGGDRMGGPSYDPTHKTPEVKNTATKRRELVREGETLQDAKRRIDAEKANLNAKEPPSSVDTKPVIGSGVPKNELNNAPLTTEAKTEAKSVIQEHVPSSPIQHHPKPTKADNKKGGYGRYLLGGAAAVGGGAYLYNRNKNSGK